MNSYYCGCFIGVNIVSFLWRMDILLCLFYWLQLCLLLLINGPYYFDSFVDWRFVSFFWWWLPKFWDRTNEELIIFLLITGFMTLINEILFPLLCFGINSFLIFCIFEFWRGLWIYCYMSLNQGTKRDTKAPFKSN